jgi:hypothetical protein
MDLWPQYAEHDKRDAFLRRIGELLGLTTPGTLHETAIHRTVLALEADERPTTLSKLGVARERHGLGRRSPRPYHLPYYRLLAEWPRDEFGNTPGAVRHKFITVYMHALSEAIGCNCLPDG